MKWLLRLAGSGLVLALTAIIGVWVLTRASSPTVPLDGGAAPGSQGALRQLFQSVGDPRKLKEGQELTLRLDQPQLDALARAASRRNDKAGIRLLLEPDRLGIQASAISPLAWLTPYVNIDTAITGHPTAPTVERFTVGWLPLPSLVSQPLFDRAYEEVKAREPLVTVLAESIDDLEYDADALTVRLRWTRPFRKRLQEAGGNTLYDELGGEGLAIYSRALGEAVRATGRQERSLVQVLPPMFTAMKARVEQGADPVSSVN